MSTTYFSGQGKLFIASRDNAGNPLAFAFVGNVPSLAFALNTDELAHKESTTGQRLTDHRMIRGKDASIKFTLEDFSVANLALALYGAKSVQSGASVTNEAFPNPVAVDDYVRLNFPKVSSLVVRDSAGTPATLVLDTHYTVESLDHGMIQIKSLGAFTQPFKANYTYAQHTRVGFFTQPAPERYLRFEGINTEDNNAPMLVEFYRARLAPLAELPLITEDMSKMEMTGGLLYDDFRASDTTLGQFGRYVVMA
jgi:hypothetical protein